MIYCPECGTSNNDIAQQCVHCGMPLPNLNQQTDHLRSTLYCPNCGTVNAISAFECVKCNTALPRINTSTPIPQVTPHIFAPSHISLQPGSFWQRLGPDIRAALLTSFVVSGLQAFSNSIPGLGFVLSSPFAITAYYIQGIVTGRLTKNDTRYKHYKPRDYARLGAASALWTSVVIATMLTLLVILLLFPITVGAIIGAIPIIIFNRFTDIFLNIVFATLGSWLYGRSGGKGVVGVSVGVLGCGISFVCLLSVLILSILATLGYNLFQGVSGFFR